jgi:hypothetical protein
MALIKEFANLDIEKLQVHEPVEAALGSFEHAGDRFVQINTYGRSDRKIPGKTSQSIQLDRNAALKLVETLKAHFDI